MFAALAVHSPCQYSNVWVPLVIPAIACIKMEKNKKNKMKKN
jgi:hypothetical protein